MENFPKATRTEKIEVLKGFPKLEVIVLDNGKRVIEENSLEKFMKDIGLLPDDVEPLFKKNQHA